MEDRLEFYNQKLKVLASLLPLAAPSPHTSHLLLIP